MAKEKSQKQAIASQSLGTAATALQAIPVFGQIVGGALGLASAGLKISSGEAEKREEEARQQEAMKQEMVAKFAPGAHELAGSDRPSGGSMLGSVFGNMGSGVGTFGAKTNAASEFSVMGAMQNNMQLQKPTAQPLDIPQETPERPNMGTPQQAQPQQDLPQQQNATPKMGASNQQAQSPLGSELSNILTGLGSGGGGFYG